MSQVCCGIFRFVVTVRLNTVMAEECRVEDKASPNSSVAHTTQSRNVQVAGKDSVGAGRANVQAASSNVPSTPHIPDAAVNWGNAASKNEKLNTM